MKARDPQAGRRASCRPATTSTPTSSPRYNPWDQRLCLVPDGDLFEAIRAGRASVVTDRIETFTENGIQLALRRRAATPTSIVTATGLNLLALGGMSSPSTAARSSSPKTMGYKGMMLSGVPNLALALRLHQRLLDAEVRPDLRVRLPAAQPHGRARLPPVRARATTTPRVTERPFIDFTSGYVLRSIDKFPKQGSKAPWRLHQNYALDILALKFGSLEDDAMEFSRGGAATNGSGLAEPPDDHQFTDAAADALLAGDRG